MESSNPSNGGSDHVDDPSTETTSTNRTTYIGNSRVPTHIQRPDIGYVHSRGHPYGMPNQPPTWYPWQVGLVSYYGVYATGRTNLCHYPPW